MAIYGTIFLECRESFSRHEQEIEVWEMSRDLQWKKYWKMAGFEFDVGKQARLFLEIDWSQSNQTGAN